MKAFTCMAIAQQKLIRSAGNFCVAIGMNGIFHKLKEFLCIRLKFKTKNISPHIGYITYWAFIASFSWLTVDRFDHYRIIK